MKHSKTLAVLVTALMLTAMIFAVSCESNSPTGSLDDPQLSVPIIIIYPRLDGTPRPNGIQVCSTPYVTGGCGERHQLWAIGYGDAKVHFHSQVDAESYANRVKNGDR